MGEGPFQSHALTCGRNSFRYHGYVYRQIYLVGAGWHKPLPLGGVCRATLHPDAAARNLPPTIGGAINYAIPASKGQLVSFISQIQSHILNNFQLCNENSIGIQSLLMPGTQNSSCKIVSVERRAAFNLS